jgi:hypothetical protein
MLAAKKSRMSKKKYRTDFLFPRSDFFIGMGSVFNMYGNYFKFNYSLTEEEADSKAIEYDWAITGQDIEDAIKTINTHCADSTQQLELAFTR